MFVRLDSPFVEVGVPLAALGGNFVVDEHKSKAVGMRGQATLSIGDAVKVEIVGVDEDLRRVSAWVTEARGHDDKGKPFVFTPALVAPATLREADFVPEKRGPRPDRGGARTERTGAPRAARRDAPSSATSGTSAGRGGYGSRDDRPRKPKGSVRAPSAGPARVKRGPDASRPKPPVKKRRG
jgi:ribonuclease R